MTTKRAETGILLAIALGAGLMAAFTLDEREAKAVGCDSQCRMRNFTMIKFFNGQTTCRAYSAATCINCKGLQNLCSVKDGETDGNCTQNDNLDETYVVIENGCTSPCTWGQDTITIEAQPPMSWSAPTSGWMANGKVKECPN